MERAGVVEGEVLPHPPRGHGGPAGDRLSQGGEAGPGLLGDVPLVDVVAEDPLVGLPRLGVAEPLVAEADVELRPGRQGAVRPVLGDHLLVEGDGGLEVAFRFFLVQGRAHQRLGRARRRLRRGVTPQEKGGAEPEGERQRQRRPIACHLRSLPNATTLGRRHGEALEARLKIPQVLLHPSKR